MMLKDYICKSSHCRLSAEKQLNSIIVHGAKEHNLKEVCLKIPKKKLVALTGLSGSGKSSIAFNVLGQECVRQYLESLGMTTDHVPKAKVGALIGLSPSICISQRVSDFNSRSTIGTKTGILTILRNLFASIGHQPCTGCGNMVKQPLQDKQNLTTVIIEEEKSSATKRKRSFFECPNCGEQIEKLKMEHFSFNTTAGACENCKGVGEIVDFDISNLLDKEKSISEGGVKIWDAPIAQYKESIIRAASKYYKFSFDLTLPIGSYTQKQQDFLLYGVTSPEFIKEHPDVKVPKKVSEGKYEGIIPYLMELYKNNAEKASDYALHKPCTACNNTRLGRLGRRTTVAQKTITELARLTLSEFLSWIQMLPQHISNDELQVLAAFSNALEERTSHLIEVGLGYLTLERALPSLSAGESQRSRLAAVLGSGLTDVLYILDEPTTGLHPYDTEKLLKTLGMIQEMGNTVLVIEHDLDVISNANYIIDVGPGRGRQGGNIVVSGTLPEVIACEASITGQYLKKIRKLPSLVRDSLPPGPEGKSIIVRGVCEHNLKNIDVHIPINQFVVLTGVSGSGKSTFLFDVLDKIVRKYLNNAREIPGKYASILGLEHIKRVITIDQATIGKTKSSRSNVATYTKLFSLIRGLFAALPEAKTYGFGVDSFSFNISNERCTNCNGSGIVEVNLAFMPEVEMECPVCNGMRFNEDLLSVKFQGRNIAEILDMTVSDAIPIFCRQKKIFDLLNLMKRVGLEHLTLGQSTSTLSGGEAQRIKLASELSATDNGNTLYLLDEPTTGLHAHEVGKLLTILKEFVVKGNTVVVIEHNLDIIFSADTLIDFGPGGGNDGGRIVATGTPQQVAKNKNSLTGQCLQANIMLNAAVEKSY